MTESTEPRTEPLTGYEGMVLLDHGAGPCWHRDRRVGVTDRRQALSDDEDRPEGPDRESHGLDYPRPDYDPTPSCRSCFKAWDTTNNTLSEYRCPASPSARVHDQGDPAPGDCRCFATCLPKWSAALRSTRSEDEPGTLDEAARKVADAALAFDTAQRAHNARLDEPRPEQEPDLDDPTIAAEWFRPWREVESANRAFRVALAEYRRLSDPTASEASDGG